MEYTSHAQEKERLLREFFSLENTAHRFIYGISPQTVGVLRRLRKLGIEIEAFIDDHVKESRFKGKRILHSLESVPVGAVVFVADWAYPVSVIKKLKQRGIPYVDIFFYWKCYNIIEDIPFLPLWEDFSDFFDNHVKEFNVLKQNLADEESKDVLNRIIRFRRYHEVESLDVFRFSPEEAYFEPFLDLKQERESFADIGSFDGLTSIQFIKNCPDYSKIWVFEPNQMQMEVVKTALEGYYNIDYCPYGAWDKSEMLRFDTGGGVGSAVSEDGDTVIQAARIDDVIDSEVTFIKMDIEGSEANAIKGAKETILKYHPRMAISVYHRPGDMVEIPKLVLSIRDDYKLYMRHYSECMYDTVMFFIPSN